MEEESKTRSWGKEYVVKVFGIAKQINKGKGCKERAGGWMAKDTKIRVLELLNEHLYPTKIAKSLKLTLPTISGHINRLEKKGYITLDSYSTSKTYHLTEQGLALLLKHTNPAQPVPAMLTQTLRIHSLAIAFPLRTPLAPSQPAQILQSKGLVESLSGLKNQQSAYTQDGLLTPSSLILYLPELELDIHSDPRLAIKPLISLAIKKAEDYEVRLGLSLKRHQKGCLAGTIIMNHNANTENAVAKKVLEKLEKFEVKDEFGNIRLIVDASDGVPEFEAVNAQNAVEDITKAQDHYLAMIQGRYDYRKEQDARMEIQRLVSQAAKIQLATNLQLEKLSKEINTHLPFWESMNIVAAKLTNPNPKERKKAEQAIKDETEKYRQKNLFDVAI